MADHEEQTSVAGNETLPGIGELRIFSQDSLGAIVQAIKSCGNLPAAGEDHDFYYSFSDFREFRAAQGARLLSNIGNLLHHWKVHCHWPSDSFNIDPESDELLDSLVEANDTILECVDTSLDEAAGFNKSNKTANVTIAGAPGQQGRPLVSSWNRQKNYASGKRENTYRFLMAKNIQRPQLKFKDSIDNSNTPFIPIIKSKPNALRPLQTCLKAKVIFEVKKIDPNACLTRGETALHICAKNGQLEFCKFLLEVGTNVNQKDGRLKIPLHLACSNGHLDIVKVLVQGGSCLGDIDKLGRSPMLWAIAGGYVEVVKFLLEAGAPAKSDRNWHALHEACKVGSTELVQMLINAGAPVNNPQQYSGGAPWSPLHIAVRHGNLDCIKVLIRAGANVNSINAGGHTPLHEAAYRGYEDTIKMLLLHGANPHATSNQRRTPLHEACMQGKVKSAVMLLDIGSKVNAVDLVRDTPLHLALRANHAYDIAIQLTSTLLRYGASPTLLGRDDDMPMDIAKQSYQDYCLELLEDALEIPQPLTQLCKISVRRQLACHWDNISELPLPLTLKTFIESTV